MSAFLTFFHADAGSVGQRLLQLRQRDAKIQMPSAKNFLIFVLSGNTCLQILVQIFEIKLGQLANDFRIFRDRMNSRMVHDLGNLFLALKQLDKIFVVGQLLELGSLLDRE